MMLFCNRQCVPFNMQTKFHRSRGVLEITQDVNAFMLPFHGISTCQSTYTSISYLHLNVHSLIRIYKSIHWSNKLIPSRYFYFKSKMKYLWRLMDSFKSDIFQNKRCHNIHLVDSAKGVQIARLYIYLFVYTNFHEWYL